MTRFARAKGSKASNQRIPEDATSWQEMKQGMQDRRNIEGNEADLLDAKNYNNDPNQSNSKDESISVSSKWSEFPIMDILQDRNKKSKKSKLKDVLLEKKGKTKSNTDKCENLEVHTINNNQESGLSVSQSKTSTYETNDSEIKKKNKKRKQDKSIEDDDGKINKKKKKQQSLNNQEILNHHKKKDKSIEDDDGKINKKKKKQQSLNNQEILNHHKKKDESIEDDDGKINKKKKNVPPQTIATNKNNAGFKNDNHKEFQRRKPNSQENIIFINGNRVEIAYYDGFPIKKEDAERLKTLKKEMVSKGLPKSEVAHALKLERRKAEKALAREKKKVCFNCRNSGHVLSECPSLKSESNEYATETGICFKCGSTEHTHFECKVIRGDNFKFAQCFICKEQGHIARQCPDNNRGLYPKGGACRVCGDVTHLKKDCPKYQSQQEENKVVAHTLNDQNIESLENEPTKNKKKLECLQKIIKF